MHGEKADTPGDDGMVRLGGIEPPTSGSTIRRSNQLSYNCIVGSAKGRANARKLGATPCFGKAGFEPAAVSTA